VLFADTSFWGALHLPRDTHHRDAAHLLAAHGDTPLVTTNVVRGETWTLLRSRKGHRVAVDFLERMERSARVELVEVDRETENEALNWLRRHDERAYSFVDATSFAVMRARGIARALAFDGDFSAAGFVELRP
jgi:uncharacterized protein